MHRLHVFWADAMLCHCMVSLVCHDILIYTTLHMLTLLSCIMKCHGSMMKTINHINHHINESSDLLESSSTRKIQHSCDLTIRKLVHYFIHYETHQLLFVCIYSEPIGNMWTSFGRERRRHSDWRCRSVLDRRTHNWRSRKPTSQNHWQARTRSLLLASLQNTLGISAYRSPRSLVVVTPFGRLPPMISV